MDCVYPRFRTFGGASLLWDMPILSAGDMISDQWVPGPGVLMKREFYDEIGGYCEEEMFRYGNEDWDFWLGAASAGFVVERVPQDLYHYRISGGSLSNSTTKRRHYRTIEGCTSAIKALSTSTACRQILYDATTIRSGAAAAELATVSVRVLARQNRARQAASLSIFLKRIAANFIGRLRPDAPVSPERRKVK